MVKKKSTAVWAGNDRMRYEVDREVIQKEVESPR